MIVAICIGREGSKGLPNKNTMKLLGIPMMMYSPLAANKCKYVDHTYFSTESEKLKLIAEAYRINTIDRPLELATDAALADGVFVHAYEYLNWYLLSEFELVVLLFANAPCVNSEMISDMITIMRMESNKEADSICTVSKYNMFSPNRMRRKVDKWLFSSSYVQGNCDRDSDGDFYIYDCSCAVVRPECLEHIHYGLPPQMWLGRNILYYDKCRDIPALDVDYMWQVPQVEYWLRRYSK